MTSPRESPPSERLDDFVQHDWCNALLSDPAVTQLHKREMPSVEAATRKVSNTYFAQTLFTDDAIRAWLYLYRSWPKEAGDGRDGKQLIETPGNLTSDEKRYLQEAVSQTSTGPQAQPDEPETIVLVSLGRGIESGANIIHGGVTASLLDQAMGRHIWYMFNTFPATAEITVKYKRPVPTPSVVLCQARVTKDEGRFAQTVAWMEDGNGKVFAEARARFLKNVARPSKAKL